MATGLGSTSSAPFGSLANEAMLASISIGRKMSERRCAGSQLYAGL